MNYSQRFKEIENEFVFGKTTQIHDSKISIQFFPFTSNYVPDNQNKIVNAFFNDQIVENCQFSYPVFVNSQNKKTKNAIILMHGLNERYWSKYLTWAEYICKNTGKPVILFPFAYHINRSPLSWTNPRVLKSILDARRIKNGDDRSLSYANIAFSERITDDPRRFYNSGKQSINDLTALSTNIKSGKHPLFEENTHLDFFAYSIGAFLSQIAFMVNPNNLFTDSKLFMFCGGGIFSEMFGESRSIMDKTAYQKLYQYYACDFSIEEEKQTSKAVELEAFYSMLNPLNNTNERIGFFEKIKNRLSGVSLKNDKVIPFHGVIQAVGQQTAKKVELLDFDYTYSHENPFPLFNDDKNVLVNDAFSKIFRKAACFLA